MVSFDFVLGSLVRMGGRGLYYFASKCPSILCVFFGVFFPSQIVAFVFIVKALVVNLCHILWDWVFFA